ncbi:MAG: DUF2062 domain-containing protein [Bacteriovoracaceae bacterium]|nr:DUF2062 domain-containing protein [Bacteriovoracaceae bacterium]
MRPIIAIPTYNNPSTILEVVKDVGSSFPELPILIIDDGSDRPITDILECGKLSLENISIHRFETNKGKGCAIQMAFKLAISKGFTHMVSIDGDGQHLARDIAGLIEQALARPWSLIIGKRKWEGDANVPGSSKFGRKFSNWWVEYQTGKHIEDSQSGLRLYPLFFVQNLKFFCKRYDFEIEVLIRLLWMDVEIDEVSVDVYYPPPSERISHFNKLWDNVKISLLNTVLVAISMVKGHGSIFEISLSLGLGVFIGLTPFLGFHTFIVIAVAFALRLNAGAMWFATQVSIPPLIPIWIMSSLKIGSTILGTSLAFTGDLIFDAKNHFSTWLLGSLCLGAVLGLSVFLVSYLVGKKFTTKSKVNWNAKSRGGALGNGIIFYFLKYIGRGFVYKLCLFIVPYFYFFSWKSKRASKEYLQTVFPNSTWWKRQFEILKHYYSFSKVLVDKMSITTGNFGNVEDVKISKNGYENMVELGKNGRGSIIVGSHIGCWHLATYFMHEDQSIPGFYILKFKEREDEQQANESAGSKLNYILVEPGSSPLFQLHSKIKDGHSVIMMGDRPDLHKVELVPFLGKLFPMDSTPFRVSMAEKVPITFSFGFKSGNSKYDFYCEKPMELKKEMGKKEELILKAMEAYALKMEELVTKYPFQWFNFYQSFSKRPHTFTSEVKQKRNSVSTTKPAKLVTSYGLK